MDNYGWSSHPVKSQGGRIMSLQVEKLENNTAKLTIEVEASKFDKAIQKAYQKNKNKFNIPGFRKGKVPYAMVEKMYGAAVFYEDAAKDVYKRQFKSCHPHLKLKSSCLFMKYSSKRDGFFVYYTSFTDIIYLL